jgi:hypothetical protein
LSTPPPFENEPRQTTIKLAALLGISSLTDREQLLKGTFERSGEARQMKKIQSSSSKSFGGATRRPAAGGGGGW